MLNIELQGSNQILSSLPLHVRLFEAKLRVWKVQPDFPSLEGQEPPKTLEYVAECPKLIKTFN